MEDYYYYFTSWGTVGSVEPTGFPAHTLPRNPSSASPKTRRASRGDADAGERLHHYYLDACFRCGRHLGGNKDIFMYRGDTPFCSDECRQQQIEDDEAREKKRSRQHAAATATATATKRERERRS
ncbi:FCS-Like Zinc finger 3 [Zea mays]|nr:FCS-Like Zinc finger 3 [Zea mays]AQK54327.1 OSJNBa0013K16.15-like protein [Zea mays]|eukprot:XP_008678950.2 uncharacterized protein LOC103653928 [Zea mays]